MMKTPLLTIPIARTLDDDRLELHVVDGLLTQDECQKIAAIIRDRLRPAQITNKNEPDTLFRTNFSCDLDGVADQLIFDLEDRLSLITGITADCGEPMQGQYYAEGQEFKPHTDYFEGDDIALYCGDSGQRTITVLIYLVVPLSGGETYFTEIDEKFEPIVGRALVWNNLLNDGKPNPYTKHCGLPIVSGEKIIITKWFRNLNMPISINKSLGEFKVPATKVGVQRYNLPASIFHEVAAYYHKNIENALIENAARDYIFNLNPSAHASKILVLPMPLQQKLETCLLPLAEEWTGVKLRFTYIYGIRIYLNGAILKMHRDRLDSHAIGVIINVDQDVIEEWPLVIHDNLYRQYHVTLKPGEMIFYEGSRLLHGRPIPLSGSRYANIFCHFEII